MEQSKQANDSNRSSKDRLIIFDTTLRDGEQAPGFKMDSQEKLRLAEAIARLGVDVIEAGFPAASPGDFESVREISAQIRSTSIAALARCHEPDIERSWEALSAAEKPRIHVFLATSAIHREYKLKMAKGEILRRTAESVAFARKLCPDVEFSAEDAARTEPEFLSEVIEAAIEAGASTVNIPDTVGYAVPEEFAELINQVRARVRNIEQAIISVHCHDDLGMAVANSLAAVSAGARQVECTINGIGERAGNCSLEEIAMAVRTRPQIYGVITSIDSTKLCATSRLLTSITGVQVQPNKAIVGANAFAHEAGIHQHGVMQHRETYEIMRAEDVGFTGEQLVLGKHSGRHALMKRVNELGFDINEEDAAQLFVNFKNLADKKPQILDADLEALLLDLTHVQRGPWSLATMQCSSGTESMPTVSVRLQHTDGSTKQEAAVGDGPVDATFKAILRAAGLDDGSSTASLADYGVRSLTTGEDAQGQATVHCEYQGSVLRGRGLSTDIIEASAHAFIDVVNQIESKSSAGRGEAEWQSKNPSTSGTTAS